MKKEEPHLRTKVPALSNALASSFSTEVVDVEKVLPPLVDAEYRGSLDMVVCVHRVRGPVDDEFGDSDYDEHVEAIRNTNSENSVDVKEHHVDRSFQISPAIGFIKVLQKKVGDQSSSNEEEGVDRIGTLRHSLKRHTSLSKDSRLWNFV